MLKNTFLTALLLIVLALGFFAVFGEKTALSPLGPGVPIFICGLAGLKPGWRKHAMHVAMVFALLGILAPLYPIYSGLTGEWGAAQTESVLMLIICAVYLGLGIKSFIDARGGAQAS